MPPQHFSMILTFSTPIAYNLSFKEKHIFIIHLKQNTRFLERKISQTYTYVCLILPDTYYLPAHVSLWHCECTVYVNDYF